MRPRSKLRLDVSRLGRVISPLVRGLGDPEDLADLGESVARTFSRIAAASTLSDGGDRCRAARLRPGVPDTAAEGLSRSAFDALVSCVMIFNTCNASLPIVKKEKKYCNSQHAFREALNFTKPYLVDRVGIVVVNHPDLDRFCKIDDWTVFDIQDVVNRQGYLDAVAVIMRSENDLLKLLDPFFGAGSTIGLEKVDPLICRNGEVCGVFALVFFLHEFGRDSISQIDDAAWEIQRCGVDKIGQDRSLEHEPVPMILWIPLPSFRHVTRLNSHVLMLLAMKYGTGLDFNVQPFVGGRRRSRCDAG